MNWIGEDKVGNAIVSVRVVPRASRDEIAGVAGDALKIRLRAPAVEGLANAALVRWLADRLRIPVGRVALLSGEHSRVKRVRLEGMRSSEAVQRLAPAP